MQQTQTIPLAHAEKIFRVISRIEQAGARADRENRYADASELYKLVGRLMAANGLSVFREL